MKNLRGKLLIYCLIVSLLGNVALLIGIYNMSLNSYKVPNLESLELKEDDDFCYAIKVVSTEVSDDLIYIKDEKDKVYYTYFEPSFMKDLSQYMMVSYSTGYSRNNAIKLSGYKLTNITEKIYNEKRRR